MNVIYLFLLFNSLRCMKLYIRTVFESLAKKHLPFFSCFVKKNYHLSQQYPKYPGKFWSFVETFFKAILQRSKLFLLVTWHDLPLFQSVFPKINVISLSCATCIMMYDAYVMQGWCDDVMLCKVIFRRYTHICDKTHNLFVNQHWLFAISLP